MWLLQNKERVLIKIYADDKEQNLNIYTDYHLVELVEAINASIKTPDDSILQYQAEVYIQHACFKEKETIIEIICFKRGLGELHQIALPRAWCKNFVGRKILLSPPRKLVRTWPSLLHAAFVRG